MPCNCDHMEPTQRERESYKIMTLLLDVGLLAEPVPFYGNPSLLNDHVKLLCDFCQSSDVGERSLELQIWWRDHQKEDLKRLKLERESQKTEKERQLALSKLTPYEINLLKISQ